MMDARFPRNAEPRQNLDRLRAAWDWARQTHPAIQEIDRARPSLTEIPVGGVEWVLQGLIANGATIHACITSENKLNVMRSAPTTARIQHILVDLPGHLSGQPAPAWLS